MQKIRFFFILLLFPFSLLAQQKTKITLQSFDHITVDNKTSTSYLRNPVFRQDNATLACDSAVFFESKNVFDAFNHVHINQADTINIYSDRLTYDGNTKNAHLTSNVKMIDRESTLTTNILDYNLGSKVGTYITGGKIVNKDVTLTSKNGYYFSNSRDAYFRYNVVVVTPQTVIKSDTLRYNTLTNWTYFYGPTNIKGKDDNLYTENGAYNTRTQYAYFGKKNLYTQGSKSLKGDSLYYDGIAGYGKAVRNIIFRDTTDKTVMYGQLGYYYKIDQRTIVTKNAYIGLGTSDSLKVNNKLQPDSLWMGADTLETQMVLQKTLKLISSPVLKKDNEMGEEEEKPEKKIGEGRSKGTVVNEDKKPKKPSKKDQKDNELKNSDKNVKLTDSSKTPLPALKDSLSKDISKTLLKDSLSKDNIPIKKAEIPILKDSLKTAKTDSTLHKKPDAVNVKTGKTDTTKTGIVKTPVAGTKQPAVAGAKTPVDPKLAKKSLLKDSLPFNPADTIKTRAIKAYHHVRVFKSNMQARADSLFYTSADSTLRWYGSPVLWAEGSQQTGDTIYLRLKDKQLNTSQVIQNAFLVNVNIDSARYNQIKGKIITGFFKDGKLNRMFVDGNAESIYFNKENNGTYSEMNQTVSSRIKILFKNKEIDDIVNVKDTEGVRTPIKELKEDVFLTGFTWKPELRPLSKKEVISGKARPKTALKTSSKEGTKTPDKGKGSTPKPGINQPGIIKPGAVKPGAVKAGVEKLGIEQAVIEEATTKAIESGEKLIKDMPLKADSIKAVIMKQDTTKRQVPAPSKKQ